MTWLKGQTTWANLASDLTKLACGEMADGSAVTAAVGDRWLREYDTTSDAIRSPASKDLNTGACSMRAGYWALTTPGVNGAGHQTSLRQTALRNALTAGQRVCYRIRTETANSVAGDYSTASVSVWEWDMDSTGVYMRYSTTVTPNAAGDITIDGMTMRIANPTGIIAAGLNFFRMFTSAYLGGIDYWPMYYKRSAAASFSTAPPGTAGTDYDIVEIAPTYSYCPYDNAVSFQCHNWTRSNWGTGLGIKTVGGLTGAVYVLSFPMALHKIRMYNRGTGAEGILALAVGRMSIDGAVYRQNGGQEASTWCRPFQTPAQVTSAAVISYWMSVKPDGIMLVLSGDPGLTGKTSCAHIGTFTPYDTNYDVQPVIFNTGTQDYTGDSSQQFAMDQTQLLSYWAQRKRLDGTEGARDWQTKWMRCDLMEYGKAFSGQNYTWDQAAGIYSWGALTSNNNGIQGRPSILPLRQLKPHPYDAKWWLYGVAYSDTDAWSSPTSPANPGTMDDRQIRGVANSRWWWLPSDGWANLDELTDSSNGNKYLLAATDYHGIAGRVRVAGSTYMGGVAIAEV